MDEVPIVDGAKGAKKKKKKKKKKAETFNEEEI